MSQTRGSSWLPPLDRLRMRASCFLCLLALLSAASPAIAHRAHAGLTQMALGQAGKTLEITHRLYAHDLEPRLFHKVYNDWAQSPRGIARVGAYCRARFALAMGGKALALDYVGAEPEGEFIYVYFTAPQPQETGLLQVRDGLLSDVLDDQVNLVNLTLGGQTQSRYFRYGDEAKAFDWPGAKKN